MRATPRAKTHGIFPAATASQFLVTQVGRTMQRPTLVSSGALASAISVLLSFPAHADPPTYQIKDLGTLGGRFTEPTDINDAGQVTGYSETADGQIRAFVYSDGELMDLGSLGGGGSLARAINEQGQVAGFSITSTGLAHAFLYDAGTMTDLGSLGASSFGNDLSNAGQVVGDADISTGQRHAASYASGEVADLGTLGDSSSSAVALNDAGQIAGTYQDARGTHAFLYSSCVMTDLMPGHVSTLVGKRVINGAGQVAGSYQADTGTRGFLFQNGALTDLGTLGGDYTDALAISGSGLITGISAGTDGTRHAFVYSFGTMTDVGTLGGTASIGYAINDAGTVVGEAQRATGELQAFAYVNGAIVDLGALLTPLASGITDSVAYDVNRFGEIVGRYSISDPADTTLPVKHRAFIATPISALFDRLLEAVVGVGPGHSLENKVREASAAYSVHDLRKTCKLMRAFAHELKAQRRKKIPDTVALSLLDEAQTINAAVGCH